jgi:thiol-disulfide isomerase/thioredoxin
MKLHHVAIIFALLCLTTVQLLWAGGLLDRDARRLEQAKQQHAGEIERALDAYRTRVERANTAVSRTYEQLINRYEARGERDVVEQLRAELEYITSRALGPASPDGADDDDAEIPPDSHRRLIETIGPVIVNSAGRTAPSERIAQLDYVMLYYTASWCRPCRVFTPELIQFYNQNRRHGNWEIIVVSGDRSEEAYVNYLQNAEMPWAAVPYHRSEAMHSLYPGGYPRVLVLDREGRLLHRSRLGADGGKEELFREIQRLVRQ